MLHKMGGHSGRKVSPPTPTVMTADQKSNYLANLRNNRPVRPTGSRPPPFKPPHSISLERQNGLVRSDSTPTFHSNESNPNDIQAGRPKHGTSNSISLPPSAATKGRPLAQAPNSELSVKGRKVSPTATIQRAVVFSGEKYGAESINRELEKEEAHSLREALTVIDQTDEERRIYEAAQQEAADLVWKHLNPRAAEDEKTAPYRNPDTVPRKTYGSQLGGTVQESQRSTSDSSTSSSGSKPRERSRVKGKRLSDALKGLQLASEERTAHILAAAKVNRRRSSGNRQVSSGSSKGIFRNPDDQIYEEPQKPVGEETKTSHRGEVLPLKSRPRNSLLRGSRPLPEKPGDEAVLTQPRVNRFEIHRNPPSQSRNAAYTANTSTPIPRVQVIEEVGTPKSTSSLEVRSDDIRAATSMKKKDRSPKLPTPTAVSDRPGRPIVSFDRSWKPSGDSPRNSQDVERPVIRLTESPRSSKDIDRPPARPVPSRTEFVSSAPVIPTISLPDDDTDMPTIQVEEASEVPVVNVPTDTQPTPRPLPKHASTTLSKTSSARTSRLPWLHSGPRGMPAISCSSCALPIAGRVVTASGSNTLSLKARLHPECFTCHHCSTPLECVSFYPEPDNKRAERLEAEGISLDAAEADLRFYCHLDFHEFFSPRCRSCKTPIEGEVIVAAGSEWHVGHFFCGECGDPFDSNTPFVEKDGYAYCVSCHTKRTSARCKECKKQILDELTVEALGGKWHEDCFVCFECGGGFGDDGRFFVRDITVEPTDKEKRKGITRKMEERAVCGGCEERRLKA